MKDKIVLNQAFFSNMAKQLTPGETAMESLLAKLETPRRHKPRISRTGGFTAAAAAFLLITALFVWFMPNLWYKPPESPKNSIEQTAADSAPIENFTASESFAKPEFETAESEASNITMSLKAGTHEPKITVTDGELNFVTQEVLLDAARIYLDPEHTYTEIWRSEQVYRYLETDFRPAYMPEDLQTLGGNPEWQVAFYNDGTMVPGYDTFSIIYSENFDLNYDPLRRNVIIEAAKGALPFRCALYLTESEAKSSVNGVAISAGYCRLSYGPYEGDEKTPAGYKDIYIAEFMLNGVGYYVQSENLAQEEFVNILLSLLED